MPHHNAGYCTKFQLNKSPKKIKQVLNELEHWKPRPRVGTSKPTGEEYIEVLEQQLKAEQLAREQAEQTMSAQPVDLEALFAQMKADKLEADHLEQLRQKAHEWIGQYDLDTLRNAIDDHLNNEHAKEWYSVVAETDDVTKCNTRRKAAAAAYGCFGTSGNYVGPEADKMCQEKMPSQVLREMHHKSSLKEERGYPLDKGQMKAYVIERLNETWSDGELSF